MCSRYTNTEDNDITADRQIDRYKYTDLDEGTCGQINRQIGRQVDNLADIFL